MNFNPLAESIIQDNQYNIGYICSRLQCELGRGDKTAIRFISPKMVIRELTFGEIEMDSNRFANLLLNLGLTKGDIIFTFIPKTPELIKAFIGGLKAEIVVGTLFTNFGEDALLDRLKDSDAKAIILKKNSLRKLKPIRSSLPSLRYIIVVDGEDDRDPGIYSWGTLMDQADSHYIIPLTSPATPSVLHYTSGSTGKPKGVLHSHQSILLQYATGRDVLNLQENEKYWCTADPGWVTGTSYGIIAPFSIGVTQIHYEGGYNPEGWMSLLVTENISIWYTAPTALRMLMQEDPELFRRYDLGTLKYIFSVGEPLNPEILAWGSKSLNHDIFDTYFQTETGSIMISNRPGLSIRPGSMGKAIESVYPVIVDKQGEILAPGNPGNLCFQPGWASMFVTYLNHPEIYQQKFSRGYYHTGDDAYQDRDGYFWFVGRNDDIINTAGHLISPFEIESALLEMDAVSESAAIGAPDEILFEKVVVYVQLHTGFLPTSDLELSLRLHLSNKVSSIASPREIVFVDHIPKNKSGKIMRRVLKARYLGQDPGDISTLEDF